MDTRLVERTRELIRELHFEAEIIHHPDIDGSASGDAMAALGIPLENVLKCLLLRSKKKELVTVVACGDVQVDFKKVEAITGMKKFSLASPGLVKETTGFEVGGVPPVATLGKMPFIVDAGVMDKAFVIGSAGTPFHGLKFSPGQLRGNGVTISDIAREPPPDKV